MSEDDIFDQQWDSLQNICVQLNTFMRLSKQSKRFNYIGNAKLLLTQVQALGDRILLDRHEAAMEKLNVQVDA